MLRTLYLKRRKISKSDTWGIEVSPCYTDLLRVHVRGSRFEKPFKLFTCWEWVCTGKEIKGVELQKLLERYPVAEFQSNEDLKYRAEKRAKLIKNNR